MGEDKIIKQNARIGIAKAKKIRCSQKKIKVTPGIKNEIKFLELLKERVDKRLTWDKAEIKKIKAHLHKLTGSFGLGEDIALVHDGEHMKNWLDDMLVKMKGSMTIIIEQCKKYTKEYNFEVKVLTELKVTRTQLTTRVTKAYKHMEEIRKKFVKVYENLRKVGESLSKDHREKLLIKKRTQRCIEKYETIITYIKHWRNILHHLAKKEVSYIYHLVEVHKLKPSLLKCPTKIHYIKKWIMEIVIYYRTVIETIVKQKKVATKKVEEAYRFKLLCMEDWKTTSTRCAKFKKQRDRLSRELKETKTQITRVRAKVSESKTKYTETIRLSKADATSLKNQIAQIEELIKMTRKVLIDFMREFGINEKMAVDKDGKVDLASLARMKKTLQGSLKKLNNELDKAKRTYQRWLKLFNKLVTKRTSVTKKLIDMDRKNTKCMVTLHFKRIKLVHAIARHKYLTHKQTLVYVKVSHIKRYKKVVTKARMIQVRVTHILKSGGVFRKVSSVFDDDQSLLMNLPGEADLPAPEVTDDLLLDSINSKLRVDSEDIQLKSLLRNVMEDNNF